MAVPSPHSESRWTAEARLPKACSSRRPALRPLRLGSGLEITEVGLRISAWVALLLSAAVLLSRGEAAGLEPTPFRIGFSSGTFGEVNENDALAAVKIWSQALAANDRLPLEPQPRVLSGPAEIAEALRTRSLEAINLTADEYWALRGHLASDHVILGIQNERATEDFVLLVRRDGGITCLADLRGRSLAFFESPRTRLAPIWLETLLLAEKRGRTAEFCGRVTGFKKLTRAVLPVFFRQAEACLVTRRGFDTMVELNPQVGRDLKVLLTSPAVVPALFAFRTDYASPVREQVLVQLRSWHTTVAGKQILTLFQCDRVEDHPASVMAGTIRLLDDHARLCGGTNQLPMVEPVPRLGATKAGGD